MKSRDYRKGFQKALRESYDILESVLLSEGMDIHAFSKLFDDESFQRACAIFKDRIQNDRDAREKNALLNLNDYRENPEEFIKNVEKSISYIEMRKNSGKIRVPEGVEKIFEDGKCLILAVNDSKMAHAAGSLLKGENNCPWCIALKYPENKKFWEEYDTEWAVFIYSKNSIGGLSDVWAMVLQAKDITEIVFHTRKRLKFKELQDLKNSPDANDEEIFWEMLSKIGKKRVSFYEILGEFLKDKFDAQDYFEWLLNQQIWFSDEEVEDARDNLLTLMRSGKVDVNAEVTIDVKMADGTDVKTSPMIQAIGNYCDVEIIEELLNAGADVNYRDSYGKTALYWAKFYGHGDIIELLEERAAKSKNDST